MRTRPLDGPGRRPEDRERPPAVTVVERPDPDGARWDAALTLLLEAGRDAAAGQGRPA
jgi:hypothetical protein